MSVGLETFHFLTDGHLRERIDRSTRFAIHQFTNDPPNAIPNAIPNELP
jgi:hypothetical protein